jgi:hypothetical protein
MKAMVRDLLQELTILRVQPQPKPQDNPHIPFDFFPSLWESLKVFLCFKRCLWALFTPPLP